MDLELFEEDKDFYMEDGDAHWKFTWPAAEVLTQFIYSNKVIFHDSVIVELGAGATGAPGIAAAIAGAKKVIFTEDSKNLQALEMLEANIRLNLKEHRAKAETLIRGLDWLTALKPRRDEPGDVEDFLLSLEKCDYIIASDVFYEPALFPSLVKTISLFLRKFPHARVYFSYHLRDENHSIEDLLELEGLDCALVRTVHKESTIQIGLIYKKQGRRMFAGIEGGGTQSTIVFLDETGKTVASSVTKGSNLCLNGIQANGDLIANLVREEAKKNGIHLPLEALGMGLSGAEDAALNSQFVDYLHTFHGDVAKNFSLESDAVCFIQAAFEKEGVVMIAGTGSSTRLLKADGSVHGVGGWGHMIGDGGSGFWLSQRAIRTLFDDDDGLEKAVGDTTILRKTILEHFQLTDKTNILPLLYSDFEKHKIASLCKALAQHGEDPVVAKLFYDVGDILGRQIAALSRHMDKEMLEDLQIVTIGSVFKAWKLCVQGFLDALKKTEIKKVCFCHPGEAPAVGAAIFAAREGNLNLPLNRKSEIYEEHII